MGTNDWLTLSTQYVIALCVASSYLESARVPGIFYPFYDDGYKYVSSKYTGPNASQETEDRYSITQHRCKTHNTPRNAFL